MRYNIYSYKHYSYVGVLTWTVLNAFVRILYQINFIALKQIVVRFVV